MQFSDGELWKELDSRTKAVQIRCGDMDDPGGARPKQK